MTAVEQALKEARAERRKRHGQQTGERTWLSFAGVVTMLVLVVVAVIVYFSFQRPEAKPTASEPTERQSARPGAPVAIIVPSLTPQPTTPGVAGQPSARPTVPVAVEIPSRSINEAPLQEEATSKTLDNATEERPWVNSLGMKFVPVAGTQVLFSIWDTRVQDFEAFVRDTGYNPRIGVFSIGKDGSKQRGATWEEPGFRQGATHPVVGVSWNVREVCLKTKNTGCQRTKNGATRWG